MANRSISAVCFEYSSVVCPQVFKPLAATLHAKISTPQIVPISRRCPTCTYKCKVIERVEIRSLSETPIIHATPLVRECSICYGSKQFVAQENLWAILRGVCQCIHKNWTPTTKNNGRYMAKKDRGLYGLAPP